MSYTFNPEKVTYFAMTDIRAQRKAFGIKQKDRDRHMYIIGKTGMGKSTLLENLAIQDIQNDEGICFIDPHGSTAEKLLDFVPQHRMKDVMYFAPFDVANPIAFNVMEDVGYDKRHLVASGLMSAFHRIWGPETWSARMEYILQNCLLALLETPDTTLMDVNRLLSDAKFRSTVVKNVQDPIVRRYWDIEFAQYTDRYKQEAVPAIQNKIGQFVSNPLTRNIVAQPKSAFDMRKLMDERKIVIINLSKGRIGEQNADLLGSLLVVKIYLAAMSRAELRKKEIESLPKQFLYIDEFQSVVNDSFANILSEARKYGLCMTIAHQYIEQMPEEVASAVFGNVGTTITFRIGPHDAETLEKIFDPTFTAQDIVGLGFAQIYLSLMIDGVGSRPFSAQTLGPIDEPEISYRDEIIEASRVQYGTPRKQVEDMISLRERGLSAEFKGNTEPLSPRNNLQEGSWGSRGSQGGGRDGGRDRGGDRRSDSGDRGRDRGDRDRGDRSDSRGGDRYGGDRGARRDSGRDSGRDSSRDSGRDDSRGAPARTDSRDRGESRPRAPSSPMSSSSRASATSDAAYNPATDGGFRKIDDLPKPLEKSDSITVGPLIKEEMPLVRKIQEPRVEPNQPVPVRSGPVRSGPVRSGPVRSGPARPMLVHPAGTDSSVPTSSVSTTTNAADALKEALAKLAKKEEEREQKKLHVPQSSTSLVPEHSSPRPTEGSKQRSHSLGVAPMHITKPVAPSTHNGASRVENVQEKTQEKQSEKKPAPVRTERSEREQKPSASAPAPRHAQLQQHVQPNQKPAASSVEQKKDVHIRPSPPVVSTPPSTKTTEEIELEALRALLQDE